MKGSRSVSRSVSVSTVRGRMQSAKMAGELITCTNPHCAYQWKPKVKEPKSCPKCRQYLKKKPAIQTKAPNWR
jgi:ssDNA-binding Zn-finger/Zn-ribbon topoisomerase 1